MGWSLAFYTGITLLMQMSVRACSELKHWVWIVYVDVLCSEFYMKIEIDSWKTSPFKSQLFNCFVFFLERDGFCYLL